MARHSGWTVRCSDGTQAHIARWEQAVEFAHKHKLHLKRKHHAPWCIVQGSGGRWGVTRSYGCLCRNQNRRGR